MKGIADIATILAVLCLAVATRIALRKVTAMRAARKADAAYRALVKEARCEWVLKQDYKIECEWLHDGKPSTPAGWVILFAEENSLGERRVRVIHKPDSWRVDGMKRYAELKAWQAAAQPRLLPRPDRVPA